MTFQVRKRTLSDFSMLIDVHFDVIDNPNPAYVFLGLIHVAVLFVLFLLYGRTFCLHRRRLLTEFLTTVSMDLYLLHDCIPL